MVRHIEWNALKKGAALWRDAGLCYAVVRNWCGLPSTVRSLAREAVGGFLPKKQTECLSR